METKVGIVEDYFKKVGVVALVLEDNLTVGEKLHIKGHTTDLTVGVDSIQIEHLSVKSAKKGDSVGIKVSERVRKGDLVYKVVP